MRDFISALLITFHDSEKALADAERVWDRLDPYLREGLQPPGELLEEAGCA